MGQAVATRIVFRAIAAATLLAIAASVDPAIAASPPTATISDVTVNEPNTGSTVVARFKVTLSRSANSTLSFYTGDASATAGSDYVSKSGGLSFVSGGVTTKKVKITVKGDNIDEVDETFGVTLIAVKNVTIADGSAVGTINDNDGPTISVGDAASDYGNYDEGGPGQTNRHVGFKVQLSAPSPQQITVKAGTALDASGTHPAATTDFITLAPTSFAFEPGEISKNVDVYVNGDWEDESDETFVLNLSSPVDASIADGQAIGTIPDDDCTGSDPGVATADYLGTWDADNSVAPQPYSQNGAISCSGQVNWYRFVLKDATAACTLYNSRYLTVRATWQAVDPIQGDDAGLQFAFLKTNGSVQVASLGPSDPASVYLYKYDWCSGVDDSTTVWLRVSPLDAGSTSYFLTFSPSSGRAPAGALEYSLD